MDGFARLCAPFGQSRCMEATIMRITSSIPPSRIDEFKALRGVWKDLPKFANRSGLLASTVGDGNRLSISLMSLRISAMSSLNDDRPESTFPFHCPNAKIAPAATDSRDKKTIHNSGLVNHSLTILIHVSPEYPLIPLPGCSEIRRSAN